jgi:hypothetical protein
VGLAAHSEDLMWKEDDEWARSLSRVCGTKTLSDLIIAVRR